MSPGEAKAEAKASKARAKAMRPWYKKKRFIVLIAFVVLIGIIVASSSGEDDDKPNASNSSNNSDSGSDDGGGGETDDPTNTKRQDLYPDRVDVQDNDHEAEVGQSVRLRGYTATLNSAEMHTPEFGGDEFIIFVTIENRDDEAQAYNMFDWRIQTEGGQVLEPTITLRDDDLGSGDLVQGGTVTGTVAFDVGPGTYYVIYKPDFASDRGIWRVTVS